MLTIVRVKIISKEDTICLVNDQKNNEDDAERNVFING